MILTEDDLTPVQRRALISMAWRRLFPTDAEWLALRDRPPNTWLPCPWEQFWQEEWDARTLGRASDSPDHEKTLLRAAGTAADTRAEELLRAAGTEPDDHAKSS